MKKITTTLLLWALIALGFNSANAQNQQDCEPCQQGTVKQVIIPLCNTGPITGTYQVLGPNGCIGMTIDYEEDFVFVLITVKEVNCNGIFKEYIEDAIYVNRRHYLENEKFYTPPCAPPAMSPNPLPPCIHEPMTPSIINQAIADAIAQYVGSSNFDNYSYKYVVAKGACYSLAKVSWPQGAFVEIPGGDGNPTRKINLGGSESFMRMPCGENCCVLKLKRISVTNSNGETVSRWSFAGLDQPNDNFCEGLPMPDFNTFQPKPTGSIIDPITGDTLVVEPTLISQEPCAALCPLNLSVNSFFKTSITTDLYESTREDTRLLATPIPAKNSVSFSSNVAIKSIKVFDYTGRRVYENSKLSDNKLDISNWKSAQYYIQIELENDEVKTLKILKN